MRAAHPFITSQDIAQAWREAEAAHVETEAAWARVEAATEAAQVTEAKASALHERAARLSHQLGFRRPAHA